MSKRIVSIILSVMMLVSLMPAMTFAAGLEVVDVDYDVNADYGVAIVTYNTGRQIPVVSVRHFISNEHESDRYNAPVGSVAVSIGLDEYDTYYYDLNGASIVYLSDEDKQTVSTKLFDADEYCSMVNQKSGKVKFKAGYDVWDLLSNASADAEKHYVKFVKPEMISGANDYVIKNVYHEEELAFDVEAVLPTYEKYEEEKIFDVSISVKPVNARYCDIGGVLKKPRYKKDDRFVNEVFIDSSLVEKEHHVAIARLSEMQTIDVSLDSINNPQTLHLNEFEDETLLSSLLPEGYKNDIHFNFVVGFYNGKEQNFNVETKNVDVAYSTNGKTWTETAPSFKNATIGLGTLVEVVDAIGDATGEARGDKIIKYLVNNSFQMKVKTGTDTSVTTYVVPIILPKELFVDFKSKEFNFLPGKTPQVQDVLTTNILTGYEDTIPTLLNLINDGLQEESLTDEYIDLVEEALNILNTERTNICDEDKEMADRFIKEFFELEEMPKLGSYYPIDFKNNVKLDLDGLLERISSDDEFAQFLKNYDILGQLFMMQSNNIGWVISNEKWMESTRSWLSFLKTTGDMRLLNNRITISLEAMLESKLNFSSTVTYSTKNNVIHANSVTKTYHVKKAKTLKKNKSFYYKASADYGMVTYQKLSTNKKVSINKYTGKVTVKKGLKRGKKYNIKVLVKAPGMSVTKTIAIRIVK